MRRTAALLVFVSALLLAAGCASPGGGAGPDAAGDGAGPSVLKLEPAEVPEAVRRIEACIDRKSVLLGKDIEIHASRNYEWDVALSGDDVTPHTAAADGRMSVATGHPRAVFRNLDIRADRRIVVRFSGLDVAPFIRITARGSASWIDLSEGGGFRRARRAGIIRIENERIEYQGEAIPAAAIDSAAAAEPPLR